MTRSTSGLILLLILLSLTSPGQAPQDTIALFHNKKSGEDITYFSPLRQFADKAILTRANGKMPIFWYSMPSISRSPLVTYEFLIGHSTGTSSGERFFDLSLNGELLCTLSTQPKQSGLGGWSVKGNADVFVEFKPLEYDVNGDVFGKLFITLPAGMTRDSALFGLKGQDQSSRDWMMIFNYSRNLKIEVEPTNLILREDNSRQMNVYIDYPLNTAGVVKIYTGSWSRNDKLNPGFNKLGLPSYPAEFSGRDSVFFVLNDKDTMKKYVNINPIKPYTFHIIHHSHNDIGYSHLQTEVERIQSNNIRAAIRWVNQCRQTTQRSVWHIESLWAVENFLRSCTKDEEQQFVDAVKSGHIVLSANYANIMSGLCQPEEQNWVLEYAGLLEKKYGFEIRNAMITDIPGVTYSALASYVNNDIPYLSIGPNYVETQPDRGDRVGGIIREQGDKVYYWKPDVSSDKKLLVWTAGKGYSYFHNITDGAKQASWENRLSKYCEELNMKSYPYEMVQLRYTKNADNGPVDTGLCAFVEAWNKRFSTPQLVISDVNTLFEAMEKKHGKELPVVTGEISPYWEDGAWSTAGEEMENREIAIRTIAMEKFAKANGKYDSHASEFCSLRKNVVLFHEHTWGSWCSISDPEIAFTTDQWKIKKSFLDSARTKYQSLARALNFHFTLPETKTPVGKGITNFELDPRTGGLQKIMAHGKNLVSDTSGYAFFEMIYVKGIDPSVHHKAAMKSSKIIADNKNEKVVEVQLELINFTSFVVQYRLDRKSGLMSCHVAFDKIEERDKESLHMAMPFNFTSPELSFGSEENMVIFNADQLPGSNKDFINAEQKVVLQEGHLNAVIRSTSVNMFEVGSIIDESRASGAKVWKTENTQTSNLFLYILNNYWHTNFKAWQSGKLEFEVELVVGHGG